MLRCEHARIAARVWVPQAPCLRLGFVPKITASRTIQPSFLAEV